MFSNIISEKMSNYWTSLRADLYQKGQFQYSIFKAIITLQVNILLSSNILLPELSQSSVLELLWRATHIYVWFTSQLGLLMV